MSTAFHDRYSREPVMTSTDPAAPTGATVRVAAASARTDVIRTGAPAQPGAHRIPEPRQAPRSPQAPPDPRDADDSSAMTTVLPRQGVATPLAPWIVRAVGAALALASGAWAGSFLAGLDAATVLGTVLAVAFQGSMLALLAVVWRTRATGARTAGRALVAVQGAVLALATVQSAAEAIPGADVVAAVLDPFWPLSMLGMLVVGITVACVGRWRGLARVWVVVATSWILGLPLMMVLPEQWGGLVATGHILLGYVVLGAVLAIAPGLTRR